MKPLPKRKRRRDLTIERDGVDGLKGRNEMLVDWPKQRLIESLMRLVNLTAPANMRNPGRVSFALQEERRRATALLDAVTR